MTRQRRALMLGLALHCAATFGCRETTTDPMTRETFIDVVVELRRAAAAAGTDTAAYNIRRDSILRAFGVTDSMLLEYVNVHGTDIRAMSEIWDTIDTLLIELPDSAPDSAQ